MLDERWMRTVDVEVWVPEIADQDDAILSALVPDLMLKRIIENQNAVPFPSPESSEPIKSPSAVPEVHPVRSPRFVADANVRTSGVRYREMEPQPCGHEGYEAP